MFANKSKVESHNYSIDLSKPVGFFCKLANDIVSNSNLAIGIESLFTPEFNNLIGFENTEEDNVVDYLAALVAQYYQDKILDEIDIARTEILFIYKYENLLFCYDIDRKAAKDSLTNLIKKENVFKQIISNIGNSAVRVVLENLQAFQFQELFSSIVTLIPKGDVSVPYIPFEFFDSRLIEEDDIDIDDIIVNTVKYKKELEISFDQKSVVSMVNLKVAEGAPVSIGIRYNSFFFPTTSFLLEPLIKTENKVDYYWLLFKRVFSVLENRNKKALFENELLKEFKANVVRNELSFLLSSLEKNFLIKKTKIDEYPDFNDYFEEVTNINNLSGVSNFEFYVSNSAGKTALGIYANAKIGNDYNLMHWVKDNSSGTSLDHFRNSKAPDNPKHIKKFVLKPELAFYFLSDYYEDFLEKCLVSQGLEFIKNFKLYVGDDNLGEIDFLVKSKNTLCFIEAKTKLTNFYIDDYIIKCEKILKQLGGINLDVEVKFYIIAAFSDSNCENKRYFIDENDREGYNSSRVGLDITPYYFEVPIPKYKKTKLICVAEPEFERLRNILKEI